MKKIIYAFLFSFVSLSAFATPQTYNLVCNGSSKNFVSAGFEYGRVSVGVTFQKWGRAAGPDMPVGFCSWEDRGMRNYEPAYMIYYPDPRKAFFRVSYSPGQRSGVFTYTPPCVGVCGDSDINVALFNKMIQDGASHVFSVYNNNDGAMVFVP
jgi:hypothetical protein